MAENSPSSLMDTIREARRRWEAARQTHEEQIEKLRVELQSLQELVQRTQQESSREWDEITRVAELAAAHTQAAPVKVLEDVLGAVGSLMTCTIPEHVFATLTEEAAQWGVRAAVFDVRGKAAWGAAAHGFGATLTQTALRSLIIPLSQDNPFRQVCETGGPVDATTETFKKNRNLLGKIKPAPGAPILLLPIRSTGMVSAIFYADGGEDAHPLPINALKIVTEFAGAQIDRLIALGEGWAEAETKRKEAPEPAAPEAFGEETAEESPSAEPAPPAVAARSGEEAYRVEASAKPDVAVEADLEKTSTQSSMPEPPSPSDTPSPEPSIPETLSREEPAALEVPPPQPKRTEQTAEVPAFPWLSPSPVPFASSKITEPASREGMHAAPAGSEADEKLHKDARRFAKLLVSEIELYNKAKVADGRMHRDLYVRLKSDIDRSRQTFEKRFSKTLGNQFDYFHDELVRTLAQNDLNLLGPEYPGPSA